MADYKHFRIIVDLSAFYYDHRRVARVFIKNLKSISDLQTRISEIFEINEFYLTTGGHFLPASEDIRILSNNECVCVIPNKPQEITAQSILKVTSSTQQKKHKNQKRALEPVPEDSGETSSPRKKKSKKKHVDVTSLPTSSSEDEVTRKNKKSDIIEDIVHDQNCSLEHSPRKVKQNSKNADTKHCDSSYENGILQKQTQSIVEKEICNIESSQKIIDIKKKLKQKADEYIKKHSKETSCHLVDTSSNIKTVLPKLQTHIKNCNDLGRSNLPDTVRLSRRADTPRKTFIKYTPPMRITDKYLAKNKINIVKIDIVRKDSEDLNGEANVSQSFERSDNAAKTSNKNVINSNSSTNSDDSTSPPKNYVKEVISTFEKNISPDTKKENGEQEINKMDERSLEVKESEASNYTKAFLDQRDVTLLDNFECKTDIAANLMDVSPIPNTISNRLENQDSPLAHVLTTEALPITKPLADEIESTNISSDFLSIPRDTSYSLSEISKDSLLNCSSISLNLNNSSVRSKHTTSNKIFGGVGSLLEHLRESDSVISHESDASSHVTKRKRVRKHRRKNKKSDEGQKSAKVNIETYVVKPMNVKASPSIHIKFEDNEMDVLEDRSLIVSDANNETNVENSSVNKIEAPECLDKQQISEKNETKPLLVETMVLSDENDDPIMENKSIFGDESILKAPLMTDRLEPKIGDVIAFKIIKLTQDYTPQVSNYIVGKLEMYVLESKTVYFKIIRGEEELLPPSGKLSLNEDPDAENSKYKEFLWTDLIAPKLLYP